MSARACRCGCSGVYARIDGRRVSTNPTHAQREHPVEHCSITEQSDRMLQAGRSVISRLTRGSEDLGVHLAIKVCERERWTDALHLTEIPEHHRWLAWACADARMFSFWYGYMAGEINAHRSGKRRSRLIAIYLRAYGRMWGDQDMLDTTCGSGFCVL